MLKIRRPLGRLIFNMGIAIPGKTVFLIETAPWLTLECILNWQEAKNGRNGILTSHVPAIIVCYNGLFVLGKLIYYTSGGYVFFICFAVCLEFGNE